MELMRRQMESTATMVLGGFCWFTALAGSLLTLFVCSTAVAGDLRRGTVRMILSRPVSRTQFLLGRFCGAAAVMLAWSVLSAAAFAVYSYGHGLDLKLSLAYAPWLMLCQNLMLGSAALLLSLLVHPAIAGVAAFFASATYFSPPNPLYYILPSYDRFNLFTLFLQRRMIGLGGGLHPHPLCPGRDRHLPAAGLVAVSFQGPAVGPHAIKVAPGDQ